MATTERDRILRKMTDEARHTSRTTIDVGAFLALSTTDRAARWRQWSRTTKRELVIAAAAKAGFDWDGDTVERAIDEWDRRYSASPITTMVTGKLDDLTREHAHNADRAADAGRVDDAAYFRRWSTAYRNAGEDYANGARPLPTTSGAWVVDNSRRDGTYTITGGHCTCKAGERGDPCRHAALVLALEAVGEDMDAHADPPGEPSPLGDEPGDTPPSDWRAAPRDWPRDTLTHQPLDWYAAKRAVESGRTLGQRLAAARNAYMVVA